MAGVSDPMDITNSLRRYMQRRRYNRLEKYNRGARRLRMVKLGGHNVWRLKSVPKLRLIVKSVVKESVQSWLARIRDAYVNMKVNLAPSRVGQPSAKRVEKFNDKVIVEMYRSLGLQVQVVSDQAKARGDSLISLRSMIT